MSETEPEAARSLARNLAVASFFMVGVRMAFRLIGLVSSLILVRLLEPNDFGIVGLATAVWGALDTLTETSFGMALIRLPSMTRAHMDTAWTFQILRGLLLGGLIAASAGLAVDWMGEPRVAPIMWVLAALCVVQGFENVGLVAFRRDLQFGKIFEARVYAKLISFSTTIPLAFATRSYWSLVAGIAAGRLFTVAFSYRQHPYRARLSLRCWRELFHFSKWFVLSNCMWLIDSYSAVGLFSRIGGANAVGLYQVAYQVASLPASEIAAPIREPIYSGYAKVLDDTARLRRQFVDGFALLMLVIAPMSVGIALVADLITPLALGVRWGEASGLIRLCAIYALFDAVAHFPHNLLIALNRQRAFVLTFAAMLSLRFPLFIWSGSTWGMQAGVATLAGTAALSAVVWMRLAMPLIGLGALELLTPLWRTAVATLVMAAGLLAFADLRGGGQAFGPLLLRALMTVAAATALHVGTQSMLWVLAGTPEGPEARVAAFVRSHAARLLRWRIRRTGAAAG